MEGAISAAVMAQVHAQVQQTVKTEVQKQMQGKGGQIHPQKKFAKGGSGNTPYAVPTGAGAGYPTPTGPGTIGEVRYDDAATAHNALALNGSDLCGAIIGVELDAFSKDGTRLKVTGIPKGADWQELKDHFATYGRVAFANVKGGKHQTPRSGIVRYDTPDIAASALATLNGADFQGWTIEVKQHGGSKDATKLAVFGLPPSCEWQDLKDYFGQCGTVVFADILGGDNSSAAGATNVGEIRYDDAETAQRAMVTLNGTTLGGLELKVILDQSSHDGTKLMVFNISPGIEWQELKDHFGTLGRVAFANVRPNAFGPGGAGVKAFGKGSAGKSFGKGKGAGAKMNMGNVMSMNPYDAMMLGMQMGQQQMYSGKGKGNKGGWQNANQMQGYMVPMW